MRSRSDGSEDLLTVADELYALPPGEFTAARNQRAAAVPERELASRIKALRKPSTAAWAVNLLVRTDPELADGLLEIGTALRAEFARGHGPELVRLRRQRRGASNAAAKQAADLAAEEGVPLSPAIRDQVASTIAAAILDERVGQAFRTGLLLTVLDANGIDPVDVTPALAVPEALGLATPTTAADPVARRRKRMHVVSEEELGKRARQEAKKRLKEAEAQVADWARQLAGFDAELARHDAATLQANAELDELTRQIDEVEARLEEIAEQVTVATGLRAMAEEEYERVVAERDAARAELDHSPPNKRARS